MRTVVVFLLLLHPLIPFTIMGFNFCPGILSATKLIVFLRQVPKLQGFVGNVHMAMIFLALFTLDKLESFFKTQFQCHLFCINPSLTLPITSQSKSFILIIHSFIDSFIRLFFESLYDCTRHSSGCRRFSSEQKEAFIKFSFSWGEVANECLNTRVTGGG